MALLRKRIHPRLTVQNFGPIRSADLKFGSLTVLVGPQATGKSIFVQLLKLVVDIEHVKSEFRRAGVDWGTKFDQFLDVYFGEGMRSLWEKKTSIHFLGETISLPEWVEFAKPRKAESMFFIPAQRVLTMRDGWPQAFNYYDAGVPFTVREFSEELRLIMSDYGAAATLFPAPRSLKDDFRKLIQRHIFPGFSLKVNTEHFQKRMVLSADDDSPPLPFMVWSAGQREFVPLLLGLSWLLIAGGAKRRKGLRWVVIEELEMGLHPRAIAVVILMVFELMSRGYRVCLSTHSPQVLDALWALKHLKESGATPEALLGVFDAPTTQPMRKIAESVLKKTVRIYYFDRKTGGTRDISNLDVASAEEAESGWGGLSEFSGRANEAVARAVAKARQEGREL